MPANTLVSTNKSFENTDTESAKKEITPDPRGSQRHKSALVFVSSWLPDNKDRRPDENIKFICTEGCGLFKINNQGTETTPGGVDSDPWLLTLLTQYFSATNPVLCLAAQSLNRLNLANPASSPHFKKPFPHLIFILTFAG